MIHTVQKPKAMQPGQTVGLIAPSFVLPKPELLPVAVEYLEQAGYHVVVGASCLAKHGYFAGNDALRAADINRMFRDDRIDAVLCARGGYGATRILPMLEYDVIRANPKVFSGFSDVTALHSALLTHADMAVFHGLMAVSDMAAGEKNDAYSLEQFWKMVGRAQPAGLLENPAGCPRQMIRPGKAQGPLVGGNLMLVASCLHTPYAFDFEGAILFLEEINEQSYAVDRLLTQLKNAGVFDQVAGVVLGGFSGCEPKEDSHHFTLSQVFEEVFAGAPVPVMAGLQCGHIVPRMTLPLGIPCALDADNGTLEVLEAAVV